MSGRGGYEFDRHTRRQAILKWHRENPGNESQRLEVDHMVPVWYAKKHGIHKDVISSLDNARALPYEEHRQRDHLNEEEINSFLTNLLNFVGNLL